MKTVMDLSVYSKEVQAFLEEVRDKRERSGVLDYDICQSVLKCAADAKSDAISGIGYYYFAEYYMQKKDTKQAMHCLAECAECFQNKNLPEYLPRVYNMMGVISESTENGLIALSYYYSCLQYAELYKDTYAHAMADSNVGYLLLRMRHYAEAKEHYYRSISYFEVSESTIFSSRNIAECMIYTGLCHALLKETKEILAIQQRLHRFLEEHPECEYSELGFDTLEAVCENYKGNSKRAEELADHVERAIVEEENLEKVQAVIVIIADLLDGMKDYPRRESLMRLLSESGIEENSAVFLDLYPFKSRYLLENRRMGEYIDYTRKYLSLYQQKLAAGRKMTAQIVELQEKLSRVELEQKDIRAYNHRLESIALYDSMTGLANRAYLNEYLSQKFEDAYRRQLVLGVELMDIDHFKAYNDTYGHLDGDICIEAVAKVLRGVQNERVFCARYGGDEFMIVYSEMTNSEILQVADTIQCEVRELNIRHEGMGSDVHVTVTQGIFARIPDSQNREWDFNSMADTVLYHAKREGRNRYRIVTDFD